MAPHCSTLAWKIPWIQEPGRLLWVGHEAGLMPCRETKIPHVTGQPSQSAATTELTHPTNRSQRLQLRPNAAKH